MTFREYPNDRVKGGCRRCGHPFDEHALRGNSEAGRCETYHCRCRGWVTP